VKRLRDLGLLDWLRRCVEDQDEEGRFRLRQLTNAYGLLPPSQWRGFAEPPPPPPPQPGTWGERTARPGLPGRRRAAELAAFSDGIFDFELPNHPGQIRARVAFVFRDKIA
jgi:hypothetical protein